MRAFMDKNFLLSSETARILYHNYAEKLPIIDYHCHVNPKDIAEDKQYSNITELWLGGDHYKWRAMRSCGVAEKYITGDASFYEKYLKYAEIFPLLCGGPLYYWTQLELKLLFDIREPLNSESAERIWNKANKALETLTAKQILKKFRVEYVATTDDPASPLSMHGMCGETNVRPTYRPDFALNMDAAALERLEQSVGRKLDTLAELKKALEERLDYFLSKGCKIADHGMDFLPMADIGEERAAELYAKRATLTDGERQELFSHLMYFTAAMYAKRGIVMQLHFATFRNVNSKLASVIGRDSGFDIMRGHVDVDALVYFFDELVKIGALPKTVIYTLNPSCAPAMATLTGAFPNVRVGAAWWFNDTVEGIREQLKNVSEYAVLGTNLGMLTDSRSLASYARFDFFRRILADFVGGYVERGEYDMTAAKSLMYAVCYGNVKAFLNL